MNLTPLLAVIGAASFVVTFALQGTLSNLASGILIMLFKPFDVGDAVEVGGGIEGRVARVSIFSTYIQTDDGFQKIVPNESIWKNVIVNRTTGVVETPKGANLTPAEAKSEARSRGTARFVRALRRQSRRRAVRKRSFRSPRAPKPPGPCRAHRCFRAVRGYICDAFRMTPR